MLSLNDITVENLKLRPIIGLIRTFTYKNHSKLFKTTFKESIHHLRHLKVA